MSFSAVVVAAGEGLRAGPGEPKAWRELGGRPILRWSVEGLLAAGAREIVVVVARDRLTPENSNDPAQGGLYPSPQPARASLVKRRSPASEIKMHVRM